MIREIKKIDLWSALKISFLIHAVIGIFVGILIGFFMAIIFSFAGSVDPRGPACWDGFNPAALGIFGGFLIGLFYALMIAVINGIIVTLIFVLLYNLFAAWFGGIKLHFKDEGSLVLKSSAADAPPAEPSGGTTSNE